MMKIFRMLSRSIRDAFKSVFRNFSLSLASISCITITLIIVAVSIIASFNVENFTKEIEKDLTIVVYLDHDAEKEDIEQEGLIGLFKAIKSYQPEKQNSFKTFANVCIERQLITAIKSSNRQKHMPLNSYLSLNNSAYENEEDTQFIEIFNNKTAEDPLDTITKKEYYESVENAIDKNLSDFEKKVLNRYLQGESYIEISNKLDTPVKSIDNAIQRIRKKALKNIVDN